ncbi:Uncharacterised protein [[Clostridium] sordellii]|uniref:hypothetical protein n=1 Tax=Paraclostridium sordellii TaxID=1505 RepID=UPI0005E79550|nr:hypothetical protein [Paeniclostridium sordellii]CEO04869.1 Uncharacterised protein [[Clostridium] sordellii] [Paeniclostridium sordellii]
MLERFFKSLNPMELIQEWLLSVTETIVLSSYWVCVIAGVIGLLLYICGCKKGKNIAIITPAIYIIIRILGSVVLGV